VLTRITVKNVWGGKSRLLSFNQQIENGGSYSLLLQTVGLVWCKKTGILISRVGSDFAESVVNSLFNDLKPRKANVFGSFLKKNDTH
jgi:hypothetical protein